MPRNSTFVSGEDLATIDGAAAPSQTAFAGAAAGETSEQVRRAHADAEIEAIMRENAAADAALAAEFEGTLTDGL
jgi:hypothetical protein